ncbi:MAG TPA: hypothetical protein VFG30_35430, partial [Polyangiales bacterium]|nr:hypothetical protein [Polyangiales bacterium]
MLTPSLKLCCLVCLIAAACTPVSGRRAALFEFDGGDGGGLDDGSAAAEGGADSRTDSSSGGKGSNSGAGGDSGSSG